MVFIKSGLFTEILWDMVSGVAGPFLRGVFVMCFVLFVFRNLNFENQWKHLCYFDTGPSTRSDHKFTHPFCIYRRF